MNIPTRLLDLPLGDNKQCPRARRTAKSAQRPKVSLFPYKRDGDETRRPMRYDSGYIPGAYAHGTLTVGCGMFGRSVNFEMHIN